MKEKGRANEPRHIHWHPNLLIPPSYRLKSSSEYRARGAGEDGSRKPVHIPEERGGAHVGGRLWLDASCKKW